MAQVAEVEQFEEKKVFLGLNKMDSCGQKSTFSCNCGLYHNAYTGMGRKKVSSGTEDSSSLLFPNF